MPDIEEYIEEALDSIPAELRRADVERRDRGRGGAARSEPPGPLPGDPADRRNSYYGAVLPDKITIYRGPLVRLYGGSLERLRAETKRVVLHEIAHHFGISDERLVEIDRY